MYTSGKAPEKEDFKYIAQVHVVREQRKMFALTKAANRQTEPPK